MIPVLKGQFKSGALEMAQQDIQVVRIQQRVFRALRQQVVRMVHDILVDRRGRRDEENDTGPLAPSGTAGGMKVTAFCSVMAIMYTRLQLRTRVEVLGRRLPLIRLYAATSTFLLYTLFLLCSIFLLTWTENMSFLKIVFESAAALSTGGLSAGATAELSFLGKLVIMGTMIIGRIGVLTFGTALLNHDEDDDEHKEKPITTEDLAV